MNTLPNGPSESDPSPPGSDVAIQHVGGGWFEVYGPDGTQRVRGREAAEALASPDSDEADLPTLGEDPEGFYRAVTGREYDAPDPPHEPSVVFRGPALTITLPEPPDPGTVTVTHPEHGEVAIEVDGVEVSRLSGHFGKGRWTVHYLPA